MGPGRFVAAFKKSVAFYVNDLILNVIALGDVILLAFFLGAEDLGIYFICSRIAVLMNVFLTLVSSHNSPALAKLIVNGEHSVSIEIMSLTSKMLSFISVPLVFLVIVFSADLLLFWDVDERYGLVLEILFLGRFFNVLTGNVGKYLIYSEKRRIEVLNNTISFTLMILLIAGLVPWYGIIGAAVANSLGLIVLNIVKYVEFKTFFSSGYIGITQIYYTVLLAFSYCLFKLVGDSLNPVVLSLVFLVFYLGLTVSIAKRDIINYLNLINAHKKTVLVE
ncbi:hypothetical protein MACH26_31930 [Planctobacterium marinum]|uniref:Polysaccharide biosynthesis protein C-terminal domain-containing protein n=2 Tax=Planctobacterium marinum TaxID=1631968 RepID=A0AA48HQ90_9ALTE|nr:hypothetical protein MACH26_31930 [Planctobacterium marinum]